MSNSANVEARGLLLLLFLGALFCPLALSQTQKGQKGGDDPTTLWFARGEVPRIRLRIAAAEEERLRAEPRTWVKCVLIENDGEALEDVALKLKGAAGSFREYDDQPALTIRVDKFGAKDRRFHGMEKFHLNNSVQDPTLACEYLGSEIFRAAGIPATLVTHARVFLNDRDMGLYVLKEGFDAGFLRRNFGSSKGNLYDGGFCQDIDADLEKDSGKGPDDRSDLRALATICATADLTRRWALLERQIDIDRFISFMAIELMLGHWDGYAGNQNNYRLHFDAGDGRAFFLPHGMDQIFQDAEASVLDMPTAMVARSVMQNPAWRQVYRKRLGELLPLLSTEKLTRRTKDLSRRLAPILKSIDPDLARAHEQSMSDLEHRIEQREKSLREQRQKADPKPLVFVRSTPQKIGGWRRSAEVDDARLAEEKSAGEKLLIITSGPSGRCIAGFRRNVLLSRGRYRFTASVRTKDLVALDEPEAPGLGAGIRISGARREGGLVGSGGWKTLEYEFEIEEETRDVELIIELRAARGGATFRLDTLKLARLGP